MDDLFYSKYGVYETYPISDLKHIREISFYNHNYYIGVNNSLIYAETDELSELTEYYHIQGNVVTHIGFAYSTDKYITLSQTELS